MEPQGLSSAGPDIMNDAAFDPSTTGKDKEEQDTCRICRGEGSVAEPLFYPCKCSGSIKFVHQDCLMEWLSHSQKKHCELCKTPFRFTKLYHPQMPTSVPFAIFCKQASLHTLRGILTWARWNLVIFIWLGWVPWCMRTVWRGLFWIGDGGWITAKEIEKQTRRINLERLAKTGTSPAYRGLLSPEGAALGATGSVSGGILSSLWRPVTGFVRLGNSVSSRLIGGIYWTFRIPSTAVENTTVEVAESSFNYTLPQRPSSLLSDFGFLRNLTRNNTVNNIAIDVLEGQLITLAVAVIFILVFLIREWVVQQQPALNAEAMPAEAQDQDAEQEPEEEEAEANDEIIAAPEPENNNIPEIVRPRRILPMPMLRARPNLQNAEQEANNNPLEGQQTSNQQPQPEQNGDQVHADSASSSGGTPIAQPDSSSRPSIPSRQIFTQAGEIKRTLEEHAIASGRPWPGLDVFMDLWNRADGEPETVLQIIRDEDREEDLSWIVAAMRKLQTRDLLRKNQSAISSGINDNGEEGSQSSDDQPVLTPDASSVASLQQAAESSQESSRPNTASENDTSPEGSSPESSQRQTLNEQANGGWSFGSVPLPDEPREPLQNQDQHEAVDDDVLEADQPDAAELPGDDNDRLQIGDNGPTPEAHNEETRPEPAAPQTLAETLQEWLWGQVPNIEVPVEVEEDDDIQIVDNIDEEAPFVPVAQGQLVIGEANARQEEEHRDPEVLQAAAEAGIDPNDPEAVDDGEDLEGVMELIGMQGPIVGLIQNGMFTAVLISFSLLSGVWIPYVTGKATLVLLTNPISILIKLPLRWLTTAADVIVDSSIVLGGCAFYWIDTFVRFCSVPISWVVPVMRKVHGNKSVPNMAWKYTLEAAERLKETAVETGSQWSEADVPIFSIIAHESLVKIQHFISTSISRFVGAIGATASLFSSETSMVQKFSAAYGFLVGIAAWATQSTQMSFSYVTNFLKSLSQANSLRITIDIPQRTEPLDYTLAKWDAQDRTLAILFGYLFFFAVGILYLKAKKALQDPEEREKTEGSLVEVLNQAGGVTKVILIISIEMIMFPLYCGILLDIALLPLFGSASVSSRMAFTMRSPTTSIFIHWFVGTCYMFHFALFVSMCRKIMRTGVLYFIRDPDDPSFHPVRDVLERNVYTQLRKIAFSAMVYGALVIICLGTVVWSVKVTARGVFPIQWSSNQPVFDIPLDLLAYNIVMPMDVKFFRPSKGLHAVYGWWFRKCAKWLRLSHFLFGDRREDEEGYYTRAPSKDSSVSPPNTDNKAVTEPASATFVRTGQFVRAPASDQVRLPKGSRTFVEVDEEGNRIDGKPDNEKGPHGRNNSMFSVIYIPPNFRLRIAAFIGLLWLFAATTGVGVTIIPLLLGRAIFNQFIPPPSGMNDIYAFAIGIYLLGAPAYILFRYRAKIASLLDHASHRGALMSLNTLSHIPPVAAQGLRLAYFYMTFALFIPTLIATLAETYVWIPMHTFASRHTDLVPEHTVHLVQGWTLGILALKIAARVLHAHPNTRPAQALRALVSPSNRGSSWADPDVRLATRAFVLPAIALALPALALPLGAARLALGLASKSLLGAICRTPDPAAQSALVYRYAYPALLAAALAVMLLRLLARAMVAWRARVRDEVYLIGERLHNFGEKRPKGLGRVTIR